MKKAGVENHPNIYYRTKKKGILFLYVVYIAVILKLAYFSREPGSRTSVDMRLFGTWGVTVVDHPYVIENILMFLPFEILFPFTFHIFRNLIVCIATGFICSMRVEFI